MLFQLSKISVFFTRKPPPNFLYTGLSNLANDLSSSTLLHLLLFRILLSKPASFNRFTTMLLTFINIFTAARRSILSPGSLKGYAFDGRFNRRNWIAAIANGL